MTVKPVLVVALVLIIGGAVAALALIRIRPSIVCGPVEIKILPDLRMIVAAAELFKAETGRYPATLEEMAPEAAAKAGRSRTIEIEDAVDPWGQPYIYRLVDGKPHALCLGRDDRPGGEGEDEDREWPEPAGKK